MYKEETMKKTIRTYITAISLFLIPYICISFILAILSYFMQMNSILIHALIQMISYLTLIFSALYFTSQLTEKRLTHCFVISLLYFLCSLLAHLGNMNYLHLFLKSLIFICIGLYKEIKSKK